MDLVHSHIQGEVNTQRQEEYHHPSVTVTGFGQTPLPRACGYLLQKAQDLAAQSVAPGPTASSLPGSLLAMQNLRLHP